MNFQRRSKQILMLSTSPVLLLLSACGAGTGESAGDGSSGCFFTLARAAETALGDGLGKNISYKAQLTEDCRRKTTEGNGRALVKLSAQAAQPSELVALQELKAGARSLQFDASTDNLRRGRYEKSFDSTLLPDWSLPWKDNPADVSLVLRASTSVATSAIPDSIALELVF
ncbi:MAG: hypothetical protein RIR26_667 [Pseudomonadota bacterium]